MSPLDRLSEGELLRWTVACATRTGWKSWHVPAPMRAASGDRGWAGAREAAGLCDLILIHERDPARLILAELKDDTRKATDKQLEFLQAAKAVAALAVDVNGFTLDGRGIAPNAIGVYLWRPADRPIIEQILKSKVLT